MPWDFAFLFYVSIYRLIYLRISYGVREENSHLRSQIEAVILH